MAEAVISIGGSVLANLITQALGKVGNLEGIKRELQLLESTVTMLHSVLDDAEEQQHLSSQIKDWVEKLKEAFYDLQDVLEEFNIEAMRQELRGDNQMIKVVRTFFSSSNQLAFELKMSRKITEVRERLKDIEAEKNFHLDKGPMNLQAKKGRRKREETHSFICEEDIIGRGNDKKNVMKFLLDMDVKENVSILPIVGIGGLGKTALAKFVYNDEMIIKHFHLKMWVCVSNDFDMIKIVKDIIVCGEKKEPPNHNVMDRLQIELRKIIDGRRYLLVLDDLWDAKSETWHNLKSLLMGGARGSKILITTRLPLVAKITSPAPPLLLNGLSESDSLDLLMRMAGRKEGARQDPSMLAIGKEIVKKCYGVPLIVRTIGRLLFFKETKDEWLRFKDVELPKVSQREDDIISILKLSYDHLPSHLKQCFTICSLFPKDFEIEKHTLVYLWMAEGFIQPSNSGKLLEDIAHEYFMDLCWSNFFQDFKKDPYTKEETCKMHDLIHDLACLVAGNRCRVARDDTNIINERTRHISYGSTFNLMDELPILRLKASALRTFLSTTSEIFPFTARYEPTSEVDLGQLILNFKRLRILDLHGIKVKKVPRSIYKLKYLTYLDLSYNRTLKRLPNSITKLQSLQTLNLYYCYALEELPSDIKKLVSLRNLDITFCFELSYLPRGIGEINSLHRLTNFILPKDKACAKNYCGLGELKGLNNIRGELSIENLGYLTNAEVKCEDEILMGKHSLESLVLRWGDFNTDDVVIDEVLFDRLKPPSNLQSLKIWEYKGESFPKWMMDSLVSFLPRLVDVSFGTCKRCERLPPLDQLPHLKSLHIKCLPKLEYIESNQSSTSTASFPSLLKLEIIGCEKLKAMPLAPHLEVLAFAANRVLLINWMMLGLNKLKRLVIEDIGFLECLPEEGFQSLTSLESLLIMGCHQLTSLWQGMQHLSSLVNLSIFRCEEVDISKDESGNILDFHGGLQSLRFVDISLLPKLTSLPQWLLQARNLERLEIYGCHNLKYMPEQIEALQSLQNLDISDCPSLTSFPEAMRRLTSLTHLRIQDCGEVEESCKRQAGKEWDKIAHIPNIRFGQPI